MMHWLPRLNDALPLLQVKCQTVVLGGLSFRDFQLAILMDVELDKLDV